MDQSTISQKPSRLPDVSSQAVRQRWFDLLELSYATRRVTREEIESGVHAIVVPAGCRRGVDSRLIESEVRSAAVHVPGMARGVRMALERLGEFELTLPEAYRGWLGEWGKDIAAGETQVTVYVDLAYLEAAMLARLWDHGVLVEFDSPLALFRRGALTDYANIYEAVVEMLSEGRSLADTADQLALAVMTRLQLYANVYLQLSSLYTHGSWQIDHDTFVFKVADSRCALVLQYWQLRGESSAVQQVLQDWRSRVEKLLQQAALKLGNEFPRSFAA